MRFRRLGPLFLSLVPAFLAAGAQGFPQAAAEEITYTMPPGWAAQPVQGAGPDMKAHYAFYYQGTPCGEMYLYISPAPGNRTVDQVFQEGLSKIRPALPYYQSRGLQNAVVDGRPTVVHDFSYMPTGSGVAVVARTYTLIAGGSVHTFWFQTVANYFQSVQAAFSQVMASVKAAPKPAPPAPPLTVPDAPRRNPAWATPKRAPAPQPEARTDGGLPILAEEPPQAGLFADPFGRYTVKLPEAAVLQKTEDNAAWFGMPAAKTTFIIHNWPGDETVAALAARFAAGKKAGGAPTVLAVDGREATVSLYTARDADGENRAWVVAAYKGSGLLIAVSLPAGDYAQAQGWIGGLLRGVRFSARQPGPGSSRRPSAPARF